MDPNDEEEELTEVENKLLKEQLIKIHEQENKKLPIKQRKDFEWTPARKETFQRMRTKLLEMRKTKQTVKQLADEVESERAPAEIGPPVKRERMTYGKKAALLPNPEIPSEEPEVPVVPVKKEKRKILPMLEPESSEDEAPPPRKKKEKKVELDWTDSPRLDKEDVDFLREMRRQRDKERYREELYNEIMQEEQEQRRQQHIQQSNTSSRAPAFRFL